MINYQTIPAAAGEVAVVIGIFDTNTRPAESDMFTYTAQVVAWSLGWCERTNKYLGAEALLVNSLTSNERLFVRAPDGTLILPEDTLLDSVNEAQQLVLERAQQAWDARHAA